MTRQFTEIKLKRSAGPVYVRQAATEESNDALNLELPGGLLINTLKDRTALYFNACTAPMVMVDFGDLK